MATQRAKGSSFGYEIVPRRHERPVIIRAAHGHDRSDQIHVVGSDDGWIHRHEFRKPSCRSGRRPGPTHHESCLRRVGITVPVFHDGRRETYQRRVQHHGGRVCRILTGRIAK